MNDNLLDDTNIIFIEALFHFLSHLQKWLATNLAIHLW